MKQKKLGNILYVMSQTPYQITKDLDVSVIYVDTNLYDEFVKLNQSLDLTRYNYLLLRKSDPEYLPYVDAKEQEDFNFPESVFNVSSFVDETKTMTLQPLSVPENYDGVITYYLDGVEIDGSTFVLENAGAYVVSAITSDSSIYEDDLDSSYVINYNKEKRTAVLSFANATVNVSTYKDENYSGTIQTLTGVPSGVSANYYLDNSLLSSNNITISSEGNHVVKGAIENDSVYNDVSTSYTISYSKVKRDAVLSFADSSVNITVEDETSYSGNVQAVSGVPTGQTVNYYLGNTLLSNGTISINDLQEGLNSYTVTAKIENSSYYNDASCSYTLNITMEISSYENKYFTIEPLEDGTIKFTKNNLQYSTDRGTTWNTLTIDTSLNVTTGNKVLFKGYNLPRQQVSGIGTFSSSGQFNISGNTMSLYYSDNFKNKTTLADYYFGKLFYNCNKLISAENLILPATTAPDRGYLCMFYNCTSLTTAPNLPASNIQVACYQQMFYNCTSLTTAPEINVQYVDAYGTMFQNCNNLNFIKILTSNNNWRDNYSKDWVNNVSTNGTFVKSKNLTAISFGVSGIPYNWTVINNETNKEVYPLKFVNTTVNVSTYTTDVDKNYSGTVLDVSCNRTIPNGLVKYYLNNTLMSGNTFELTESGTYTIKAKIDATDSIDDSEATYNIVFAKNIKKNATINVTFSSASNKLCTLNEQVNVPTISYTTNPASPEPLVNVSYSFDGQNYVSQVQSQYLDTTQYGRFTYYVKLEIPSTDQNYNAQTKIVTWNWKVGDSDLSHYTCLTDIDETLLDTSAVEFQEIIFDHSGNYTNGSAVSITLRNMTTNECIWSKNRIQTKTNGGEIRENGSSDQNITAVGTVLEDHPGYYHYMFSSPMRIYVIDANAVKSIVYFKIPQAEA